RPAGLALDGAGQLFVAEAGSHIIREIELGTGDEVSTLAGTRGMTGQMDGVGTAAQFWQPWQVVPDSTGNLYVNDLYNSALRKIVLATREVTTLTTSGFVSSSGGVDVVKYSASDITVDPAGNLYVAVDDRILKIVPSTGETTTVVG